MSNFSMKVIFLVQLFFLSTISFAQKADPRHQWPFDFRADSTKSRFVEFVPDSNSSGYYNKYDTALDSQYRLDKNYDFQFRMWRVYLEQNFDNGFILTLKDNKWAARYFDRNNGVKKGIVFSERQVDQSNVEQLWQLLVENNVLSLPPERDLEEKFVKYEIDTTNLPYSSMRKLTVTDGIAYGFELLTPNGKRFYSYGNPKTYLDHYGNIKELFQVVMIITLIQKFLGQPLKVG